MPTTFCEVCNRDTFRFSSVKGMPCTDHSAIDYTVDNDSVRVSSHHLSPLVGKVVIPAYSPSKDIKPVSVASKQSIKRERSGLDFQDDALISDLLGLPRGPKQIKRIGILSCSFCGADVQPQRATQGISSPRKVDGGLTKTRDQQGQVIDFEPKIIHVAEHKVACPACCLLIKPIYKRCQACKGKNPTDIANCPQCKGTKEGELMHTGTIFPETEG